MKEILTALMIWLGANTPFQASQELPKVIFLPIEHMEQMFYGDNDYESDQLHGLYDKNVDTIYPQVYQQDDTCRWCLFCTI